MRHGSIRDGLHIWRPVAPFSRIEANSKSPGCPGPASAIMIPTGVPCRWKTASKAGSGPAPPGRTGAAIIYDTVLKGGATSAFALDIAADGSVVEDAVPPRKEMPTTFWRMARHMRAAAPFKAVSLLEDSPFYARTLLQGPHGGGRGRCLPRKPVAGALPQPGDPGDAALPDAARGPEWHYFFLSRFSFHNSQKPKPRTRPMTSSISEKIDRIRAHGRCFSSRVKRSVSHCARSSSVRGGWMGVPARATASTRNCASGRAAWPVRGAGAEAGGNAPRPAA